MGMVIVLLYIAVAAASIFGLIVAADKYAEWDWRWHGATVWILCGVFWPVTLLPAAAYIAAAWWVANRE